MEFSILITATGNMVDNRFCHDLTLRDVVNACKDAETRNPGAFLADDEPSNPGDSEYSYLAKEQLAHADAAVQQAVSPMINGDADDPQQLAERLRDQFGLESSVLWWATVSDYQASGVLARPEAERLLETLGAVPENCGTLGTLGGPLGMGLVPDISYAVETLMAVINIRVTPIMGVAPRKGRWERVKAAIMRTHGEFCYPKAAC